MKKFEQVSLRLTLVKNPIYFGPGQINLVVVPDGTKIQPLFFVVIILLKMNNIAGKSPLEALQIISIWTVAPITRKIFFWLILLKKVQPLFPQVA